MKQNNPTATAHLKTILTEMCERVGAKYEDIDFKKKDWFKDHSWTFKQQDDFVEWFADYIKDTKVRKAILDKPHWWKTKKQRIKAGTKFVFNFGWSIDKKDLK